MQKNTRNDEIIFIGLNPKNINEVNHLRKKGNTVHFIGNLKPDDSITRNQITYNLAPLSETKAFTRTLGISIEKSTMLAHAIHSEQEVRIKDELAQLAIVLADMEKRGMGPGRVIISGHHSNGDTWGENNGWLTMDSAKKIFKLFPGATSMIEDLHISGCNSGTLRYMMKWRKIFPNTHTIWAYVDKAPLTGNGSEDHMEVWDKRTRGGVNELKRKIEKGLLKKGAHRKKNISVWSRRLGYHSQHTIYKWELEEIVDSGKTMFNRYWDGVDIIKSPDPGGGELRNYYTNINLLAGHEECSPAEEKEYKELANSVLIMLYFDKIIKKKFSQVYKNELDAAYKKLNEEPVDFSTLSRKECLREIENFSRMARIYPSTEVNRAKELLEEGLRDFSTKHISLAWII